MNMFLLRETLKQGKLIDSLNKSLVYKLNNHLMIIDSIYLNSVLRSLDKDFQSSEYILIFFTRGWSFQPVVYQYLVYNFKVKGT